MVDAMPRACQQISEVLPSVSTAALPDTVSTLDEATATQVQLAPVTRVCQVRMDGSPHRDGDAQFTPE